MNAQQITQGNIITMTSQKTKIIDVVKGVVFKQDGPHKITLQIPEGQSVEEYAESARVVYTYMVKHGALSGFMLIPGHIEIPDIQDE